MQVIQGHDPSTADSSLAKSRRRPGISLPFSVWQILAVLAAAAILVLLGSMTSARDAMISVPGALSVVFVALALLALAFILTRGGRRPAAQQTGPEPAMAVEEADAQMLTEATLRRAKDAAEAANAAKTRYLVAVSHEIRSPLNAIYGYAQLLERDGAISAAEAGGVIRRSAEHLTNLVEGLLEISRIESGVLKLRTDVVQLPILLDHVVDMFQMQAQAKGLKLDYEVMGRLPRFVRTDEKRLRQILINLLSNAIKYTREGGVTLSIAYRSQVAIVDISDTGIGIAPEDLERIFEPFERGSSPEAMLQPGLGLGLSITRMLARILGGEIVATSTLGVGSCFRLRIFLPEPLTAPDDVAEYDRVIGYGGSRRTILVIDDDQSQTIVLENLLRRLGFVVYAAGNGAEGLALAESARPELVLLDIQMPGISGWEVAARLREAHGNAIRIIMVSANAHEFRTGGDGASNHDAFVSKPVNLEALLAVIGRQLQLSWEVAGDRPSQPVVQSPPTLPEGAGQWVEQLRHLAKVGHIRAVEAALADLETNVPESAPAVAAMRQHVHNFDLRSVLKMLDGDQR
jgi:signal transduction histidine kinase/CheY-like chemotaxis protein